MSVDKAKSSALRYVAARIRTEGQVADYLRKKEFSPEEIEEALDFLREYKYVDDAGYCVSYYKEACLKGRGRRRIEQELERKKISRSLIRETIDELLSEENPDHDGIMEEILTEKERALKTVYKMLNGYSPAGGQDDKNFIAKAGRKLMSLGYGSETVYGAVGVLMKECKKKREELERTEREES